MSGLWSVLSHKLWDWYKRHDGDANAHHTKYTNADMVAYLESLKLYFDGGNVGIDNPTPETIFSVNGKMQVIAASGVNASLAMKPVVGGEFRFGAASGSTTFFIYDKTNTTRRFEIDSYGRIIVLGDLLSIKTSKTPASATDTGNQGDICWDAGYVYLCTATNTWKRAPLSTW